jgi:hypothetical protein
VLRQEIARGRLRIVQRTSIRVGIGTLDKRDEEQTGKR